MIVFYTSEIDGNLATLKGDECLHCSKVLRKKIEDEVFVTDGKGRLHSGVISQISKKEVTISLTSEIDNQRRPHSKSIAIAPTKNIDRFEWFLEKSTEIGITDIYPFLSSRSERKIIKPERLEKILISAMKQSKNFHKPTLHPISPIRELLANDFVEQSKFIAHCMDPKLALQKQYVSGSNAIVLIGPEGDFTEDEVEIAKSFSWQEISLGKSRLRTETAGIVACHLLNL
jgi:16S rRNA (uracil1498-N3)-methyltransferase